MINLIKTKRFYVFSSSGTEDFKSDALCESRLPLLTDKITVEGLDSTIEFAKTLHKFGCCILKNKNQDHKEQILLDLRTSSLRALISELKRCYSETDDSFDDDDFDFEARGITRSPRIGRGKHNFHFDNYENSQHHEALLKFAEAYKLHELLTAYHNGNEVELRETGMSFTRPSSAAGGHGEGMEFHSDGAKGENTVLMSMYDIEREQGELLVIPRSHLEYKNGVGHGEITRETTAGRTIIPYTYCAGLPMVIDARTLHGVLPNKSSQWRIVFWLIFHEKEI